MDLEIVNLEPQYNAAWDEFCQSSDDTWFWHTTKWLDYSVFYGRDRFKTKNLSFFLRDNGKRIIAICPLLLERDELPEKGSIFEFRMGGGYCPAPAFSNDFTEDMRDEICKEIISHMDVLARKYGVARVLLQIPPLCRRASAFNWLMKMGFLNHSVHSQIVDLSPDREILWKGVRKGHKSDIKRGQSFFQLKIYDKENITREIFEQYRLLHHKAAGRVTRPLETFDLMFQWILEGKGLLSSASKDGKFVGFAYVGLYKETAYYMSASDDPDFVTKVPIYHAIQWEAVCWLKENGFKKYEIGPQHYGPQMYLSPTEKDLKISAFKRGFGGQTFPLLRGEKFYDADYMDFLIHKRLDSLKAWVQSPKTI